jgi:hypothetical protein
MWPHRRLNLEDKTMTAFGGFTSLAAYMDARCRRDGLTPAALAERLQWPRNYMHGVYTGLFRPSRPRAGKLARYFGDEARLVRGLCSLEAVRGVLVDDPAAADVVALYLALPDNRQEEARRYLTQLDEQPAQIQAG